MRNCVMRDELWLRCSDGGDGFLVEVVTREGHIEWSGVISMQEFLAGENPIRKVVTDLMGGKWYAPEPASNGQLRVVPVLSQLASCNCQRNELGMVGQNSGHCPVHPLPGCPRLECGETWVEAFHGDRCDSCGWSGVMSGGYYND